MKYKDSGEKIAYNLINTIVFLYVNTFRVYFDL